MSEKNKKIEVVLYFDKLIKIKSAEGAKNSGYRPGVVEWFLEAILKELEDIIGNIERRLNSPEIDIETLQYKEQLEEKSEEYRKLHEDLREEFSAIKLGANPINNFAVDLRVNREDFFKVGDELKEVCDKLSKGCNCDLINIVIFENLDKQDVSAPINYSYTQKEMCDIVELYHDINGYIAKDDQNTINIYFADSTNDEYNSFSKLSLGDAIFVNNRIDAIVKYIKEKEFTPYEAMIYIHNWATGFKYRENIKDLNQQMIVGPIKEFDVVCAGYVSLIKAIIDKLDMPGLECDITTIGSITSKRNVINGHVINLIKIKDEKYNIDGIYFNDATWDCVKDVEDEDEYEDKYEYEIHKGECRFGRFTHFLYPVTDRNHLINGGEPYINIAYNSKSRYKQIIKNDNGRWDKVIKRFIANPSEGGQASINVVRQDAINDIEAQYEENRRLNTYEASIIPKKWESEAFKAKAKPIPLKTFIRGLYHLFEDNERSRASTNETTRGNLDVMINKISYSVFRAAKVFDLEATNCFMQTLKENGYINRSKIELERARNNSLNAIEQLTIEVCKENVEKNLNTYNR